VPVANISQTVMEKAAAAFSWFASTVAGLGDKITVAVIGGNAASVKVVTGAQTLSLETPQDIELAAGQSERSFAIVSDADLSEEQTVQIKVTCHHGQELVVSNIVTLTLQDRGEAQQSFTGDYDVALATHQGSALVRNVAGGGMVVVENGRQKFVADGNGNLLAGNHARDGVRACVCVQTRQKRIRGRK
jgi:hypothetical protein